MLSGATCIGVLKAHFSLGEPTQIHKKKKERVRALINIQMENKKKRETPPPIHPTPRSPKAAYSRSPSRGKSSRIWTDVCFNTKFEHFLSAVRLLGFLTVKPNSRGSSCKLCCRLSAVAGTRNVCYFVFACRSHYPRN